MPIIGVTQSASGVSGSIVQSISSGEDEYKLPVCPNCGYYKYVPRGSVSPYSMFDREGRLVGWHKIVFNCAKCETAVGPPEAA